MYKESKTTNAMVSALIVAAGKGTRMGQGVDKLFLEIAGRPVLAHTWQQFELAQSIDEIVIVAREGMQDSLHGMAQRYGFKKPFVLVAGGKERQDSVWNGLSRLNPSSEIVAVQDAARPCTSQQLILATIEAARRMGAAVAAQPVSDTIKESIDGKQILRTLDRSRLWSVQTPQSFQVSVIRTALTQVRDRGLLVTDDTAACELIGHPVELIVGHGPNPKVTRPEDVPYIELLLQRSQLERAASA
jgi:2-C-methyl-D-erythritol 4-phosphate cytidylyltransferase